MHHLNYITHHPLSSNIQLNSWTRDSPIQYPITLYSSVLQVQVQATKLAIGFHSEICQLQLILHSHFLSSRLKIVIRNRLALDEKWQQGHPLTIK